MVTTRLTSGFTSTTSADIDAAEGVTVYVDNVSNSGYKITFSKTFPTLVLAYSVDLIVLLQQVGI